MSKRKANFSLGEEALAILDDHARKTGLKKSTIIERYLMSIDEKESADSQKCADSHIRGKANISRLP